MVSEINILKYIKDRNLSLKVIPNSKVEKLIEENNQLRVYLKAPPDKNKANKALIKFFKENYNFSVQIKSGEKSRNKVLRII